MLILAVSSGLLAEGKVIGKTYFDFTYNPDGTPTNLFEIHRVYIGYKAKITGNISYKVLTDVGRFNTGSDDRLSVYLKAAQLAWQTNLGTFVFGLQGMNIFGIQEHNWGYRFIEKSPMDLNKFGSSADLGVGYYRKFNEKIDFSAILSNGTGYKKSENDQYKKLSVRLFLGDSKVKKNGQFNVGAIFTTESFDYFNTADSTTSVKSTNLIGGFGAYQISKLRLGAEYDLMTKGGSSDVSSTILATYANYALSKALNLFFRFDMLDPNTDANDDASNYIIAGFNFQPGNGLSIAPNVRIKSPESGNSTTYYKINFQFKI